MSSHYNIGDVFDGIVVETFRDGKVSRPRVRPVGDYFDREMNVEFPRNLREEFPLGSRFRATVTVAQKHNKDGSLRGSPYLVAKKDSIYPIEEYTPLFKIKAVLANSKSGRIYDYIRDDNINDTSNNNLLALRKVAKSASVSFRDPAESVTTIRKRDAAIKRYALARSNGVCEGCGEDAPFMTKNDEPFLEVHHITDLKDGGADSYDNVAALCPNCHRHVTYGKDASNYNESIKLNIEEIEAQF
jgi:hypothetical protein